MAYEMFTVLLVDDNPVTLTLYEKFLSSHHYQVIKAKDGTEALQKAFSERPDVILLDIMMPGLSGYDVCARLREAPTTADVPIMILTALDRASARQKALELGADDFIVKTESLESVDGRIMMLLKKRILAHTRSWLADLAGSTAFEYSIQTAIQAGRPLAVLYLDVKGLGVINEQFGYEGGDRLLWQVAKILNKATHERAKGEFVGYLGMDHFVILAEIASARQLAEIIAQEFEVVIQSWLQYPTQRNDFPSLAIGVVLVEKSKGVHLGQIHHAGQTLLKQAKAQPGTVVRAAQLRPMS